MGCQYPPLSSTDPSKHNSVEKGTTQRVTPKQTCPQPKASGATCVQRLDGSRDSAIHTKYRISLRSSSMQEPRYPLSRVIINISRRIPPPGHNRKRCNKGANESSFCCPWRALRRGSLVHSTKVQADEESYNHLVENKFAVSFASSTMILPQVHLRKPCYDFSFL